MTTLVVLRSVGMALAQPQVDVGLYPTKNGTIDVRVTPAADFDGLLSSLVITIGRTGVDFGHPIELRQSADLKAIIPLSPSGEDHVVGSDRYRIFSGIGLNTLASTGAHWYGGMTYTIASIPDNGDGRTWIVDDAWARDRRNNGAFYVSLNGLDRTGHVKDATAMKDEDGTLSVTTAPNPWNGGPLSIELTGVAEGDVRIDLADAEGRTVLSRTIEAHAHAFRSTILPETPLAAGTYLLTVRSTNATRSIPQVVSTGRP